MTRIVTHTHRRNDKNGGKLTEIRRNEGRRWETIQTNSRWTPGGGRPDLRRFLPEHQYTNRNNTTYVESNKEAENCNASESVEANAANSGGRH